MRLIAENLWTYIHGTYPTGLLDPVTSFFVDGAWFSPAYRKGHWDGRLRFVEHDRQAGMWKFPTGLLQAVLEYLESREYRYDFSDVRQIPLIEPQLLLQDKNGGTIRLDEGSRDYQAGVVETMLQHGRGVVKLATGGGKTVIGAAVIKSVGGQWAWLTHKVPLLYQTKAALEMRLGRKIGILGDQEEDLQEVTVCMVQTLASVFNKPGRENVRDWCRTCVGLIGDEVHHLESDQWYSAFWQFPAIWRFGLSATPPKPDAGGMYLQAMTGSQLCDIKAIDLIRRGALVQPRIWFCQIDEPVIDKKAEWPAIYSQGILKNEYRHNKISEAAAIFRTEGKPTLILVSRLGHGQAIVKACEDKDVRTGWVHGKVSQADRDTQFEDLLAGRLHAIVAMSETVGEGFDVPALRAIINATGTRGGGNAKDDETGRATLQFLGRVLRPAEGKPYADYVDFVDVGHKALRKASLARIETLESEGYSDFIKYWKDYKIE